MKLYSPFRTEKKISEPGTGCIKILKITGYFLPGKGGGGGGRHYGYFWVGVYLWDSETLTLYETMFS